MSMKKLSLLFCAMAACCASSAREATVASPNGKLTVVITDAPVPSLSATVPGASASGSVPAPFPSGTVTYAVTLEGRQVVLPSKLGFKADFGDFTEGLKIVNTKAVQVDRQYEMQQVKQSHFHYVATLLTVDLENSHGQKASVEFSVSDNDVAFRYVIPRQKDDNPKSAVIFSEATSFLLPDGTSTFLTPQSKSMVGWERTKPSYEEEYKADAPMTDRSAFGEGYTFPCLFRLPASSLETIGASGVSESSESSGTYKSYKSHKSHKSYKTYNSQDFWLLISETGVSSAYCGSHLSDYSSQQGYTIAYPMPGENNGRGDTFAGIPLPGVTPWRTITVGSSLKPIVETTIPYDVVEPLYTLNPQLSTLNSQLSTLNSQPSTLNPQLSTLNSQLSTLNSQPLRSLHLELAHLAGQLHQLRRPGAVHRPRLSHGLRALPRRQLVG